MILIRNMKLFQYLDNINLDNNNNKSFLIKISLIKFIYL